MLADMLMAIPGEPDGEEIRRRTVRGAVLVAARGVASRLVGLAGTIALARALSPHDFGLFAFGSLLMTGVGALTQTGIGSSLVRDQETPAIDELRAVVAVNLVLTVLIAAVVGVFTPLFGHDGFVVLAMAAALVLTSFRAPGIILLERHIDYAPVARVETMETTIFYVLCVVGAVVVGVWGIAVAAVARCAIGTVLMIRAAPGSPLVPLLAREPLRRLVGFGAKMQAISVVNFVRDQVMLIGITAIAGLPVLGTYTVATRMLQVPLLMFEALFRVSFPATARLLETGAEPRSLLERGLHMVTVGAVLATVPVAVSAPALVPAVFGGAFDDAPLIIVPAAVGLMYGGPVAVASAGYLFATNDAGTVLRSALAHTLAWCVITLPLLPVLGVASIGIGMVASSLTEVAIMGRRAATATGARWWATARASFLTGTAVTAVGTALAAATASSWPGGVGITVAAEIAVILAIRRFDPSGFAMVIDVARRFRPASS